MHEKCTCADCGGEIGSALVALIVWGIGVGSGSSNSSAAAASCRATSSRLIRSAKGATLPFKFKSKS